LSKWFERPEKGNMMGWLSSLVSPLPSPLTQEWPRPGKSVVALVSGMTGESGVELMACSYSIDSVIT
jgi:hypothetical protein